MRKSDERAYNPQRIKEIVAKNNFIFEGSRQNDATEFFNTLLVTLNEELEEKIPTKKVAIDHYQDKVEEIYLKTLKRDDSRGRSIIDEVFTGHYLTSYDCQGKTHGKVCGAKYRLVEKFNIHYVPLPPPVQRQVQL